MPSTQRHKPFFDASAVCDEIFAFPQVKAGIGALHSFLLQQLKSSASGVLPQSNLTPFWPAGPKIGESLYGVFRRRQSLIDSILAGVNVKPQKSIHRDRELYPGDSKIHTWELGCTILPSEALSRSAVLGDSSCSFYFWK
ncbi:hypothetical protein Tco_0355486 [Tanacetum coccineum]